VELIKPDRILPTLTAYAKKDALHEISAAIAEKCEGMGEAQIYNALQDRETLGSTGVGDGIAVPHAKMAGLDKIQVFFTRSIKGVPFEAQDNRPVHLFFVMLAPLNASTSYLATLARLSRFLKSETVKSRLLLVETQQELYEILADLQELE